MSRWTRVTCAVLASVGVVAAGLWAAQAQTKEPIKVGLIQPLSGPIAAAGSYITNGAKIAVDRINAKGGVLGRPLRRGRGGRRGGACIRWSRRGPARRPR